MSPMANLSTYQLAITVTASTLVIPNARVYVRNNRSNNTLNADTDSNGQTIIECSNFTNGVQTGDILSVFTFYQNYEGSVQHTVTAGGADISLVLTAISVSSELRYFNVQDFYDQMGYLSSDTDIIRAVDIVKVGIDVEKEIDNITSRRFDSANAVSSEYHDMRNSYQSTIYLEHTPIQSITGFWVNDASEGSEYEWRNIGYALLDDFTSTASWIGVSGGSDTITLSINYTGDNINHGISCMNVAKSGTNNAVITISNASITSTNFTEKELNVDIYTDSIDDLTTTNCVEIRFGSDSSNYYYKKWSKTSFANTSWTTLSMQTIDTDCDVTGSPEIASCDYFAVIVTLAAVTTTLTAGDIRLDHLRIGDEYQIEYDTETGRVRITDSADYPEKGSNQIKINYTYGYSSIPGDLRRLAILMVARHFMLTGVGKSVTAGREFTPNLNILDNEIKRITNKYQVWDIRRT